MRFEIHRFLRGAAPDFEDLPRCWAVEGTFFDRDEDCPEGRPIEVGFDGSQWHYTCDPDSKRETLDELSAVTLSGMGRENIATAVAEFIQGIDDAFSATDRS